MAIVKDWEQPLGESVLKKVKEAGISMDDLRALKKAAHMLEGTEVSDEVGSKLEERFGQLDDRYAEALKKTEKGKTILTVKSGIEELTPLKGFQEADKKLEEAENRYRRMKRNRILLLVAVISVLAILITWRSISSANRSAELMEEITRIQTLTDDDEYEAVIEAFYSISKQEGLKKDHYEKLKQISEWIVEKTAEKDGLIAACEMFEELKKAPGSPVDKERVKTYITAQMDNDAFLASDRWEVLKMHRLGIGFDSLGRSEKHDVVRDYLEQLLSERENGSGTALKECSVDLCTTIEANKVALDPDVALRFLYALHHDGCDVNGLFPDGLLVDIPMADRIGSFLDQFSNPGKIRKPKLNTVLPVSVVEKKSDIDEKCKVDWSSEEELQNTITGMQQNNDHYEVRIMTDQLFTLPEEIRPSSFSECGSLLCMQVCYAHSSTINWVVYEKKQIGSPIPTERTVYRPAFTEFDAVVAYDLKEDAIGNIDVQYHSPQTDDDEWFAQHKMLGFSETTVLSDYYITVQDMVGESDVETLENTYKSVIDEFELYRILYGMTEEEVTDEPE